MEHLQDLEEKRKQLAGPSGLPGLWRSKKLFALSMFTALGGLCYGYEQGACKYPSSVGRVKLDRCRG